MVGVTNVEAGLGEEAVLPDGAPLEWSHPALPGPCGRSIRGSALEVVARWPYEARGPGRGGSAVGAGLCNPSLPGHRQLKEETLRGTGITHSGSAAAGRNVEATDADRLRRSYVVDRPG
jgi:hypothetical protein